MAGVLLAAAGLAACDDGDGGGGDLASFCEAVEQLRAEDPFAELEVASPEEMRTAFEELADGVEEIAEHAPGDVEASAERYRDSVEALLDQLRGAGFDPRNLDTLAYRSATEEYEAAAISVDNAAEDACGA